MPGPARRSTSQGTRAAAAISTASTADSWSTSTVAPRIRPRMMPWRRLGCRRSRITASRVAGSASAPVAMLRWNQTCQSSMAESPKSAPAAIAPAGRSHSRASRYIT